MSACELRRILFTGDWRRWPATVVVMFICLGCADRLLAVEPQAPVESAAPRQLAAPVAVAPAGDLVIRGGAAAVRVRLRLGVDGRTWLERYEQRHRDFIRGLFSWLDADANGWLVEAEAKRTPPPPLFLETADAAAAEETHFAFNFRVLDENNDRRVSVDELSGYFRNYGDSPLYVRRESPPKSGTAADDSLFRRLDSDENHFLTIAELERAPRLLELDRDANGVLGADEIAQVASVVASEEFVAGSQTTSNLAFQWEKASDQAPDMDVLVEFGGNLTVPSTWRLLSSSKSSPAKAKISGTSLVIQLAGNLIELQAPLLPFRTEAQHSSTLDREFAAADVNRDDRVGSKDPIPPLLQHYFALIDRDGSTVVERAELNAFRQAALPMMAAMEASRMMLAIGRPRAGLFDLVDRNGDGRLGARELHTLAEIARAWDADADGKLTAAELPIATSVLLRRGVLNAPYESSSSPGAGPPWFYRLDRNRDGDLSASEFPGRPGVFEKLDADRDGAIDLNEALRAERK